MKNANENYVEYARVINMCKGTKFENEPWKCVKVCGIPLSKHPFLAESTEGYSFAVAILEDEPLFVGDKVYWKHNGSEFEWDKINLSLWGCSLNITRTPPKRTFTINDEELPCPSKTGKVSFGFASDLIGFDSYSDAEKVSSAIKRILEDATK
jgi:hypothetical protein